MRWKGGGGGGERERGRTSVVEGEGEKGGPRDGLEEVVGARDEVEAVALGDRPGPRAGQAEGAEVEVRDEVAQLGKLAFAKKEVGRGKHSKFFN